MGSKFLTIVLVLVIVAIVSLGFINFFKKPDLKNTFTIPSPTKIMDLTVNWNTYKDPTNSYSFRYPADQNISIIENKLPNGSLWISAGSFQIIETGSKYQSLKEYENIYLKPINYDQNSKIIKFNGVDALEYLIPSTEQNPTSINIFVINNNLGYQLSQIFQQEVTSIENIPLLNPNIIFTFRFLD